jgi:HAMP domain-containing protein
VSIRWKLLLPFLAVSIVLGASILYLIDVQGTLNRHTETLREEISVPLAKARELRTSTDWQLTWVVGGLRADTSDRTSAREVTSPQIRAENTRLFEDHERRLATNIADLEAIGLPPTAAGRLARFKQITSSLQGGFETEFALVTPARIPGSPPSSPSQLVPLMWERADAATAIVDHLTEQQALALTDLDERCASTQRNVVLAVLAGFGIAIVTALGFAGSVVGPTRGMARALEHAAGGDLTARVSSGSDEIGRMGANLNRALDRLGTVLAAAAGPADHDEEAGR